MIRSSAPKKRCLDTLLPLLSHSLSTRPRHCTFPVLISLLEMRSFTRAALSFVPAIWPMMVYRIAARRFSSSRFAHFKYTLIVTSLYMLTCSSSYWRSQNSSPRDSLSHIASTVYLQNESAAWILDSANLFSSRMFKPSIFIASGYFAFGLLV